MSTEVQFKEMIARIQPYYTNVTDEIWGRKANCLETVAVNVVRETLPDEIAATDMLEYLAGRGISSHGRDNESRDWYEVCVGLIAAALCHYLTEDVLAA